MDLKLLASAISQIAAEKGIAPEKILEAIEAAIAAAYKKEYRKRSEIIKAKFDLKTGDVKFWQLKTVVSPAEVRVIEEGEETAFEGSESRPATHPDGRYGPHPKNLSEREEILPRYNSDRHVFFEEAKKINPDIKSGDDLEFPLEVHADFGRIAAQAAKQVVLQSIREAERSSIREEFAGKEGQIISGIVQRFERGNVYIDLGRAVGMLFYNECIPGEHYKPGTRMRFYILAVQDDPRRPGVILSRSHPDFVVKLFELEVPEMADKTVEIKQIAREPGSRTKIAVVSNQDRVDPVGSIVGQRGTRVMAVTNELSNEKIDVVEWSDSPEKFIANSLSPAKIKLVEILPRREAKVLVAEDQLSLAIGKGGQNVRLAAKLTGWKIDVRSQSRPEEIHEGGVSQSEEKKLAEENEEEIEIEEKIKGEE